MNKQKTRLERLKEKQRKTIISSLTLLIGILLLYIIAQFL